MPSSDYEIFANSDADMQTTLQTLQMTQADGRRGVVRYSVNYYGTKVVNDVAQPGVFAIVRWVPPTAIGNPFPPSGLKFPVGVRFTTPLPADSGVIFFGPGPP
jgi:hypothetical protein